MIEQREYQKLMRQAAHRARRHAKPQWLETQDLTQEATLALLEAEHKGRSSETVADPVHQTNRMRQRLWGAMIDAIRNAWDGSRDNRIGPLLPLPEDSRGVPLDTSLAPEDPMRTLQLKQAVQRFARKGSEQQLEVVRLTAAGLLDTEIAIEMGVSVSWVCKLKRQSREILNCL